MPKDQWLRARNKDVTKQARCEFAEDPNHSAFPYTWTDDPTPSISDRKRTKPKSHKLPAIMPAKTTTAAAPLRHFASYQEACKQVFVSRKVWADAGCLLPEAFAVTNMQAVVRRPLPNRWTWCVECGTSIQSGEESTLEQARIRAIEAILKRRACLKLLAALVGIALPKAESTRPAVRVADPVIAVPKPTSAAITAVCPECHASVKPENLPRHLLRIHHSPTTKRGVKKSGVFPELVLQRR